jgi:CBS domain-containing protein
VRISDILNSKGSSVVTIAPSASVRDLLRLLAEHNIGATVVSSDGSALAGIVSERDVVRALADRGDAVLADPVETIMTAEVHTARPSSDLDEISALMTQQRIRHVPVVEDDALTGIISIGDVVKQRIASLEVERDSLASYMRASLT